MNFLIRFLYPVAFASTIALSGCASEPTMADLMREHAETAKSESELKTRLSGEWERGSKLLSSGENKVSKGNQLIEDAQKDLKKGRDMVTEGYKEIDEGRSLMGSSEQLFREKFPTLRLETGK
ncbi:hypothetical protein [Methylotuvimicrobium sp. KM1]|jgi:hypothetical protein|uniref:hypothetical protein n=1 Tax=unclassified Methylotuvimicrobium TaxID=2822412 RepID=UPI003850B9FB